MPPNRPLEQPGMKVSRQVEDASAGCSAPIRYPDVVGAEL